MAPPGKKEKIKLGALLLQNGLIKQSQLDEALKSQLIFGGKLGTNLVELGFLDEEALAYFLSEKLNVPYAHPKNLLDIEPNILKLVPQHVAEKYKVLPIAVKKKKLNLVMADPQDYTAINEISFITGYQVEPMVTPELRLHQALEVHYGIRRDMRYIPFRDDIRERSVYEQDNDLGGHNAIDPATMIAPHQPPSPPPQAPPLRIKPPEPPPKPVVQMGAPDEQEKEQDEVSQEQILAKVKELKEKRKSMLDKRQVAGIGVLTPPSAPTHLTRVVDALAKAGDKNEMGNALIDYITSRYPVGVVLAVRGETAYGWCASAGECSENVNKLRTPLNVPSALKRAMQSGIAVQDGHDIAPMDRMLRKLIKVEDALVMAVVPVNFQGVPVCFIVGFGSKESINQTALDELKSVAHETEKAFARLIRSLQKDAT